MGATTNALTVLVVEDDALIRLATVGSFQAAGFVVLEAGTSDAALRILAASGHVDAVFTNIQVPGSMGGLELAHHVANTYTESGLVIASEKRDPAASELPAGAVVIGNPYSFPEVVNSIHEALK